jgi:hypothetical protein
MSLLNSLSFDRLLWLVPVLLAVHNLEEAPFMESWSKKLPFKFPFSITTRQFVIAVTFLTIAGFLLTYVALEYLENEAGYLIILGMQAILLFNAFVPHVATTVRFRLYSPGVVTAVLLIIPFSFYLFRRAFHENILNGNQLLILFGMAPFAVVIIAFLSLQIGKALDK